MGHLSLLSLAESASIKKVSLASKYLSFCDAMSCRLNIDTNMLLGSPVVPFTLFWGSGFPYKVTNPKKGALNPKP